MRYLSPVGQDYPRIKSMHNVYSADIVKQPGQSVPWETTTETDSEPLEVNIIFTEPQATTAALKAAESFARELRAHIRLQAAIVVPFRVPLDQPLVSVSFFEQLLRDLVGQSEQDGFGRTIHLYICRDRNEALLQVLKPSSLVVIGGRKHWWPTTASRMARALRAQGHRVVFVDVKEQTTGRLR